MGERIERGRDAFARRACPCRRASSTFPAARAAVEELSEMAAAADVPMLAAMAAHAAGSVLLAESDPSAALTALREAGTHGQWEEFVVDGATVVDQPVVLATGRA